ncbi:hypothetical protein [Inquilinus sp. Marseille-Q2685]|uniref:hypothetical protein n=1 Tax=Inquilinus sp. Marseille-Q2685 TaxID=2866581 RepID=UPI001CE4A47D|nr:hypothetical protein [Inquilinus sp. Marseille-Q2685]
MTPLARVLVHMPLVVVAGAVGLLWSGEISLSHGPTLMTQAHARIGRPLTPLSYAGVARRTTRRAVAVGAATAAPVVVAPAPACVQVVNAYGQIIYRCP